MTYYLGKAGALVALPDPEVGLSQSPERIGGTHQLLSGSRVRDTIGRMRTWQLSWTAIDLTTYGTLESFYYGAVGSGPYYLFDPEQRNLLSPNVSSGTNSAGTTTGFESGTTTLTVNTWPFNLTSIGLGPAVALTSYTTGTAGGSVLIQTPASSGFATPILPSFAYTWSAYVAMDTGSSLTPVINWLDTSFGFISNSSGATNSTAGSAQRVTATGTAPANAAYAQVSLHTANTVTGVHFVYTTGWQLERAGSASAWVPGTGVPLVTVDALPRSTPIAGVCDAQMTLVQVG